MKYKDYYQILGVKKDETAAGIKSAYRKMARKFHPDVNKSPDAGSKFKDINEAYEVLSDNEKRQRYDTLGSNWQDGANFTPPPDFGGFDFSGFSSRGGNAQGMGGFSDFFSSIFGDMMNQGASRTHRHDFSNFGQNQSYGGQRGRAQTKEKPKNLDIIQNLSVSISDLTSGTQSKTVNVSTLEKCPYCDGKRGGSFCSHCSGTGIINNTKRISVKIPKNVKNGQKIRITGEGKRNEYGEVGDLYLVVKIQDNEYTINGFDLTKTLEITPDEAILGTKKEIKTPNGNITITIPAKTNTDKLLRLKGMGLKNDKNEFGNLNLKIKIVLPKNIDERQIELYKQISALK